MREIITVFSFTFTDAVRKKSFKITTAVVLILILVASLLPGFLAEDEDMSGDAASQQAQEAGDVQGNIIVIDESKVFTDAASALKAALPIYDYISGGADMLEEYKQLVLDDPNNCVVVITPPGDAAPGVAPGITIYQKDFMYGPSADALSEALRGIYVGQEFKNAGVDEELSQIAAIRITPDIQIVGKMDLSGYVIGIVLTMIMFFAVYFYGFSVSMSVANEKTSRVMETLVVSAKPSQILIGKCIAMGMMGLLQILTFMVFGVICYILFIPENFMIMGMPLAITAFTPLSAVMTIVYFLLGYTLYAMLNAVCGATVSRTEDLNSASMPVMLLSLIAFYAAYISMLLPNEAIKRIVTIIPFTSPFIMPFRLLNDNVLPGDIVISLILLAITIVIVSMLSIRLYTASVLHYGQRLKIKELWKMKV